MYRKPLKDYTLETPQPLIHMSKTMLRPFNVYTGCKPLI